MNNILVTKGLAKRYGALTAVNSLDLSISKGAVFGILGPNGSGKTTTLGMILGIIQPSSGTYRWFDGQSDVPLKKRIGALLETPNFYPHLSARKNLEIVAAIKELEQPDYTAVLRRVNLADRAEDAFKTYSLGMKQRLAIASALLCNPDVLVLDEPTNGLDPSGIAEVREIIARISSQGITVILASHMLVEIEKLCSHVAVFKAGKILFTGEASQLTGSQKQMKVAAPQMEALEKALKGFPGLSQIKAQDKCFELSFDEDVKAERISEYLSGQGIYLSHLQVTSKSLESEFLNLIKST